MLENLFKSKLSMFLVAPLLISTFTAQAEEAVTSETTKIWKHHVALEDGPEGFTVRKAYPNNPDGAEMMLEQWDAGSFEAPHSHPSDDMTVVVEGKMSVQFYKKTEWGLVEDGDEIILNKGETGYIRGGRVHSAKYIEDCKLVFVHDGKFAFLPED